MKKTITSIFLLLTVSGIMCSAQSGDKLPLKVGAAKVSITPSKSMFALTSFQGYSGAHDTIYVRTIVLDNSIERAVLISLDLIGVPRGDDYINSIADAFKLKKENIFISAVHTHNTSQAAPPAEGAASQAGNSYYDLVKNATLQSVKDAIAKLQPASVGYAQGKAYVNTNRDQKLGEGYHMGYNPDGPTDKTVAVVVFTTPAGKPIAVYANYPVHSVVMYRAKTKDGKPEITGDLGGATAAYVESRIENVVALWTMGAAGDQNPLFMATYNQDAPDVFDEGAAGYALLDVQSRRLGEEIVRLTNSVKNTSSEVRIWSKETSVTCPGQKRESPAEPGVPTQGYLAPARVKMIDGDPVTIPLHLFMINDIALAGVSGEVFTEIGIHLKQQAPFDRTFIVTNLPNGAGYIPTEAAYLMPSEKAITNRLKPGAEPYVTGALINLMNEYIKTGN